jgi:plastocyanin
MRHALALVALVAVAASLATCGGPAATIQVDADVLITSGSLDFNLSEFTLPADVATKIHLVNQSPMPHNIAIYTDASVTVPLFVGDAIESRDIVYEVPALAAGTYYFRCELHPEMNGTLTVAPVERPSASPS